MSRFNIKAFVISIFVIILAVTVFFCISKPQMHKVFQFNIIEYLMKFNSDGSVSTTKNITTTVLKEKQ